MSGLKSGARILLQQLLKIACCMLCSHPDLDFFIPFYLLRLLEIRSRKLEPNNCIRGKRVCRISFNPTLNTRLAHPWTNMWQKGGVCGSTRVPSAEIWFTLGTTEYLIELSWGDFFFFFFWKFDLKYDSWYVFGHIFLNNRLILKIQKLPGSWEFSLSVYMTWLILRYSVVCAYAVGAPVRG